MTDLHPNYRFVLEKCRALVPSSAARILDYGCGSGEVVAAGRSEGLDIVGVEAFYDGDATRSRVRQAGLLGKEVKELDAGRIPFPDGYFDVVVSNQVLEHVEDLDAVLKEIHRVLKVGGTFCCLFPSLEVIREGHCGIPMVHWFAAGSRLRYFWILAFRKLGLGHAKQHKSAQQWSADFLECLDAFTFYRSLPEIRRSFLGRFASLRHIEEEYIAFRLRERNCGGCSRLAQAAPLKYLSRWTCRRLAGLVLVAVKDQNQAPAG